jgi:Transglycosylase-like domain
LRRSILACGLLLAFAGMATAAGAATASKNTESSPSTTATTTATTGTTVATTESRQAPSRSEQRTAARWRRHIRRFRADTRHWLTVINGRPPANNSRSLAGRSFPLLRQLDRRWQRRAHHVWLQATHPPRLQDWLCIHRYEGSWADSGSPYWGGLQMDLSFQQTYGGWLLRHKGTADHWSPLEQIWVAERASRSRGFSPWPNTARDCGLY